MRKPGSKPAHCGPVHPKTTKALSPCATYSLCMEPTGERKRLGLASQVLKRMSKTQQQAALMAMIVVLFALMIYVRRH